MADCRHNNAAEAIRSDCFKEAVCINAGRIYDSCRDRECLENVRVWFCERDQEIVDNALGARLKNAEVINVVIDTEPVQFNRGYYCVNLSIYLCVTVEVTVSPISPPCEIKGMCVYNKKAVLFGSEGSVKVFSSDYVYDDDDVQSLPAGNLPKATVSIAEPVPLSARVSTVCEPCCCPCCIPKCVSRKFGGSFCTCGTRVIEVTIGLFMIIQLEREVQMLIPVYDFCMPEKVCVDSGDDKPCEMFGRMSFPTNEFFPPKAGDLCSDRHNHCKCN